MTIRTITQLPPALSNEFTSSWIEMSTPYASSSDRFTSKKARYDDICNSIKLSTSQQMISTYHLNGSNN